MNKLIFIGPTYPSEDVVSYIKYISVVLTDTDLIQYDESISISQIKNIRVDAEGNVSFVFEGRNPITNDCYRLSSTNDRIKIKYNDTVNCDAFYTEDIYNISPCCVTFPYKIEIEEYNKHINTTYPITTALQNNILSIDLISDDNFDLYNINDISSDQGTGIDTINGNRPTEGDIQIHGVGAITITVEQI